MSINHNHWGDPNEINIRNALIIHVSAGSSYIFYVILGIRQKVRNLVSSL